VHQLVYEPLFFVNAETGKQEPWLATSFKYDKTNTKLTINLRQGVTWSDGVPLTSKDAVYTMNQIIQTKPAPYRAGNIQASVASVRASGQYTFVITLKKPNPRFVYTDLSTYIYTSNFLILPAHIFQGHDFKTFTDFDLKKGWPVGTGPYSVSSASQNAVNYKRNDNWWAAKTGFHRLPAPKQVIFTSPGPEDTAVNNLATNKLDYAGQSVPTVAGFITAHRQNPKLQNWDGNLGYDDPCPFSLTINAKAAPWNDPQMRWALNYAINKSQFSQLFNAPGPATPALTTFPPFGALTKYLAANADLFKTYPIATYNPQKTAQIMQSKGYTKSKGVWSKDGKPLTLNVSIFSAAALGPTWQNADALIQQLLQQAGFAVNLQPGDFGTVVNARVHATSDPSQPDANWDLQSWFECGSLTDPWATFNRYTDPSNADGNPGGWQNRQYNSTVQYMGQLLPTDKRIPRLFRTAMTLWLTGLPTIPLSQRPTPVVMNNTYWTGWPSTKNDYGSPAAWTQYFHEVVLNLKPAS
jgi:peptide/nickel transport system substrate-binding protein